MCQAVEYFQKAASAPHTLVPDELQKNPKPLKIYGVFENMTLRDETAELRLYEISSVAENATRVGSPHSDGMLLGHVIESKLVYVTDLISPRGAAIERSENTIPVGNALREFDVPDDVTFVGGHGTTVKRADITAALAPE